jgi:hypothetical protein
MLDPSEEVDRPWVPIVASSVALPIALSSIALALSDSWGAITLSGVIAAVKLAGLLAVVYGYLLWRVWEWRISKARGHACFARVTEMLPFDLTLLASWVLVFTGLRPVAPASTIMAVGVGVAPPIVAILVGRTRSTSTLLKRKLHRLAARRRDQLNKSSTSVRAVPEWRPSEANLESITITRLGGRKAVTFDKKAARYPVALRFSRRPSHRWKVMLDSNWNSLQETVGRRKRRRGQVVGCSFVLERTTYGEVDNYLLALVSAAVMRTNKQHGVFVAQWSEEWQSSIKQTAHRRAQAEKLDQRIRSEGVMLGGQTPLSKVEPPAALSKVEPPAALSKVEPPAALSKVEPPAALSKVEPPAARFRT